MEILTLLIKNASFDKIIAGEKKEEKRTITPSTQKKYVKITPNEVTLIMYDAILFKAGHEEDAPEALVKIDKTELEYEADEDGYIKLYEDDNNNLLIEDAEMVYTLGEIISSKNLK
ncbi:MAG: hypothetical protein Q4F97_03730 [Bacteroidales bacterium]|nr:hypothetical protein [Bacteroidales bacterium]